MKMKDILIVVVTLLLSVSIASAQKAVIELDMTRTGPVGERGAKHVHPSFPVEETTEGLRFLDRAGVPYEWHAAVVKPSVSTRVETLQGGGFRYHLTITNDSRAKDPIREVALLWNPHAHTGLPAFTNPVFPSGWENWHHVFTGQLAPGQKAEFRLDSELAPSELRLIVTGVDQERRGRELETLHERSGKSFARFVASQTANREQLTFDMQ